jgi:hypothetical protein
VRFTLLVCVLLAGCHKSAADLPAYIETITNEKVSCWRIVDPTAAFPFKDWVCEAKK